MGKYRAEQESCRSSDSFFCQVNRAQENIYLSGGRQDTVPPIVIAQSPEMPLSPSPATPPSAYTDVSDSSLPPQSPMEMSSPYPMHGPAGQSAAPSSSFPPGRPTALTRGPSFEAIRLNGSATLYCCRDCTYRTHRRSDMRRHREGSYHSKKKHYCSSCDKSYTRKYKLDEHERKHHLSNN
ncbi:hypothetical protein F5887DRAFT_1468 [Amanita rubescens]|nr:hypothetical protein F5887DRAFT_1468 [Amanita rubescens]